MIKKQFVSLMLILSQGVFAAEVLTIDRADLEFDTYIRVSTPAQIIESPDAALIGQTSSFIQSLRYVSSKKLDNLNMQFGTFDEINVFVRNKMCKDTYEVTLNPIRDQGTKGADSFISKIKPQNITVTGLYNNLKGKSFSQTISCN